MNATKLLTVEDLRERWGGVSADTVLEQVKENGLPFLDVGRGKGSRPLYRFRLAAVEQWEQEREKRHKRDEKAGQEPTRPSAPAGTLGWDGTFRSGGGGKKKARGKA